jgi:mannose-6-phosphate isomerase
MRIDPRKIYKLKGSIQHYAWGGYEYIPRLLGVGNPVRQPFAEYWMGAHLSAPSQVSNGETSRSLTDILKSQPELLGEKTRKHFDGLPYLFKVLDVREMLSIQVHPTKEEAEKGFDAEEERGIELNAPTRNYKDRNHKPEVMIALSDFWLLHGFKPGQALKETLSSIPEFRSLLPVFEAGGYEGLYRYTMELPQTEVDRILLPLVQKEVRRRSFHELERNEPGYWVGEYYLNKPAQNIDKGLFSIYFFNLVFLQPGQGIFQAAGIPHAYLQGQNVELMANSDNVLRGGLTNKHVDIEELMKHTRFEAVHPDILTGEQTGNEKRFMLPADDFMISKLDMDLNKTCSFKPSSPEILICINGSAVVEAENRIELNTGEVFIAFAGAEYQVKAAAPALVFRAAVP